MYSCDLSLQHDKQGCHDDLPAQSLAKNIAHLTGLRIFEAQVTSQLPCDRIIPCLLPQV